MGMLSVMLVTKSVLSRRSLLNGIGAVILIIGTSIGGFIYWNSSENDQPIDTQNSIVLPEDSRIYQRNVAMYAGTFGLLADQWTRDIERLGKPKPLSVTVFLLSILVSGGFFISAYRQGRG